MTRDVKVRINSKMRYFSIPGVATTASAVCLGTGSHGSAYSRDHSFSLLNTFASCGGTFLDTAHVLRIGSRGHGRK